MDGGQGEIYGVRREGRRGPLLPIFPPGVVVGGGRGAKPFLPLLKYGPSASSTLLLPPSATMSYSPVLLPLHVFTNGYAHHTNIYFADITSAMHAVLLSCLPSYLSFCLPTYHLVFLPACLLACLCLPTSLLGCLSISLSTWDVSANTVKHNGVQ